MALNTVYPNYDEKPMTKPDNTGSLDLGSRTISRFSLLTRTREGSTIYFDQRASAPDLVTPTEEPTEEPSEPLQDIQSGQERTLRTNPSNPKKQRPWKRAVTFNIPRSSRKSSAVLDEGYFESREASSQDVPPADSEATHRPLKTPYPSPMPASRHMFFWGKRRRENFLQNLLPRKKEKPNSEPLPEEGCLQSEPELKLHLESEQLIEPQTVSESELAPQTTEKLESAEKQLGLETGQTNVCLEGETKLHTEDGLAKEETAPPPSPWVLVPPPIWRSLREESSSIFSKKKHSESRTSIIHEPPPALEVSLGQSFTVSQIDLVLSDRDSPRNSVELTEAIRLRSDSNPGKGGFFKRRKPSFQALIPARIQEVFSRRASNWSISSRGSKSRKESLDPILSTDGEDPLSGKEDEKEEISSPRMSWSSRSRQRLSQKQPVADTEEISSGTRLRRQARHRLAEGQLPDTSLLRGSLSGDRLSSGHHSALQFQESLEKIKEHSPLHSRNPSLNPLHHFPSRIPSRQSTVSEDVEPRSGIFGTYEHGNDSFLRRAKRKGLNLPQIITTKSPNDSESDIEEVQRHEPEDEPSPLQGLLRIGDLFVPVGPPSTGNTPIVERFRRLSMPQLNMLRSTTPDGAPGPITPLSAVRSLFTDGNGNTSLLTRRASDFLLGSRVPFLNLKEMRIKVHASTLATTWRSRGVTESNTPEAEVEQSEFLVSFTVFSGEDSVVEFALFAFSFAAVLAFMVASQLELDGI